MSLIAACQQDLAAELIVPKMLSVHGIMWNGYLIACVRRVSWVMASKHANPFHLLVIFETTAALTLPALRTTGKKLPKTPFLGANFIYVGFNDKKKTHQGILPFSNVSAT